MKKFIDKIMGRGTEYRYEMDVLAKGIMGNTYVLLTGTVIAKNNDDAFVQLYKENPDLYKKTQVAYRTTSALEDIAYAWDRSDIN